MARPCTCDRFHATYQSGDCRLCWLAAHDSKYRAKWGVTTAIAGDPRPAPIPLPCVHEGHTCPSPAGVPDGRTWLRCDAGKGAGGVVCRCECNSACDRYDPGEND